MSGAGEDGELPEESLQQIRQVFELCDGEKKGYIVRDELRLVASQLSEEELNLLFDRLDSNQDGRIEFDEFVAGCASWFLAPADEEEQSIEGTAESVQRTVVTDGRLSASEAEAESALLELQEAKGHIAQLESDLSDARDAERALKSQLKFLQAQIQQAEEMNEQLLTDLNDTKAALSKEQKDMRTVNALKKQLMHMEQEAAGHAEQLEGLQAAEQRLLGAKSKLFSEKCVLESKLMEAEGELMRANQEVEALKREVKAGKSIAKGKVALERELSVLKEAHEDLVEQAQKLAKETEIIPSLKVENQRLLDNLKETEALLDEAREQHERLQEELENVQYSGITEGQQDEQDGFGESLLMEVNASMELELEEEEIDAGGDSIAEELAELEAAEELRETELETEAVREVVEIPKVEARLLEESEELVRSTQEKLSAAAEEVKRLEGELERLREQLKTALIEIEEMKRNNEQREMKKTDDEAKASEALSRARGELSATQESLRRERQVFEEERREWENEKGRNKEKLQSVKEQRDEQVSELQQQLLAEKALRHERMRELENEKHTLEVERSVSSDRERQRDSANKEHIEQLNSELLSVNEEKKREQKEYLEKIERSNEEKIQLMQELNEQKAFLLKEQQAREQLDAKYQDVCKKGQHYYTQAKQLHQQLLAMKQQEAARLAKEEEMRRQSLQLQQQQQQQSLQLQEQQKQIEREREAVLLRRQQQERDAEEATRDAAAAAQVKEPSQSGGKFAQLFASQREWNKTKPKASWALPGAATGTSGINAPTVYQARPPPVKTTPLHDPSVYDKINKHIFIAPAHHLSEEERRRRDQANSFLEKQLELAKKHMTSSMRKQ